MTRLFLAYAMGAEADAMADCEAALTAFLASDDGADARTLIGADDDPEIRLVRAGDDWKKRLAVAGGWEPWIKSVISATPLHDRRPRFAALIAPERLVGRATGRMIALALKNGKPVLVRSGAIFREVSECRDISGRGTEWRVL